VVFEILKGGTRREMHYCVVWVDHVGRLNSVCGDMDRVRQMDQLLKGSPSACLIEVGPDGKPRSVCDSSEMVKALLIKLK